jgi:methylenetetrahydrofolate--tRNA-(uracil-5-)-methyltransferase
LAGCEAAWQLAERGVEVALYEMRPKTQTPIHASDSFCELVCSNSLKSLDRDSAAGALKYELARLGSFVLQKALEARIPAGGALAVDREKFAAAVTEAVSAHLRIQVVRDEVTSIDAVCKDGRLSCIVATGPLTSDALAQDIEARVGSDSLAFYDAAAPIVTAESINLDMLFAQSRYDKNGADYLNAALSRERYEHFVEQLVGAKRVIPRDFEKRDLFQACQPVEEIARAGTDALRYGALKPVGLIDPQTGRRPWAAVQLRIENSERSAYNLVGFQTNLKFSEQERVFRLIPGLEQAEFVRYGVMHRNTFIDTPHSLTQTLALPDAPHIRFAGQITGTEGYVEAIASGLYAALCTYAALRGYPLPTLPASTTFGSLLAYATNPQTKHYQPMHVNYGIMMELAARVRNKKERYAAYAQRAGASIDGFVSERGELDFLPGYNVPFLLP